MLQTVSHQSDRQGPRPKSIARQAGLARRDALPEAKRSLWSEQIAEVTASVLASRQALDRLVVAIYAAKGSEVDTVGLDTRLRASGMTVGYPRVVEGDRRLMFHAATIGELVAGRFGLREPLADAATAIELATLNAFVVPGVAFDREGHRVGWGRGHYDATLASAAPGALRIGLAFECQLVEHVARDPHDIALDIILTEVATYTVA